MSDMAHEQMLKQTVNAIVGTERRFQEFLDDLSDEDKKVWVERLRIERESAGITYLTTTPVAEKAKA